MIFSHHQYISPSKDERNGLSLHISGEPEKQGKECCRLDPVVKLCELGWKITYSQSISSIACMISGITPSSADMQTQGGAD